MKKRFVLFIFFFLLFHFSDYTYSQNNIITSFEASSHSVIIYYEFAGDKSSEYEISITLKRTTDPDFNFEPSQLSGDIGKGKYGEGKRKVFWYLSPKEESTLIGDDFYFELVANEIKKSSGIPWYVFVGGALLGGGTAAALLIGKKSESSTSSSFSFPKPPGRPGE
ncbi:MAG: hypothetical protein M1480_09235 [Bacteroidetes bacterium]|nr:hypothetical protein [Bacteroidota bacterium]